jgi:nucleotide-binding universal stress UspA family protein
MFKHILVPTDGSELSQKAVQKAVIFAKEIDAKITFFCAVPQFPVMYYGLGAIFDSHSILDFEEESKSVCNEILNKAKEIAKKEGGNSRKDRKVTKNAWKVSVKELEERNYNFDCKNQHKEEIIHQDPVELMSEYKEINKKLLDVQQELKSELLKALGTN